MKSRGDGKRLWVGVLIALPSGAGVALSVLGGNTGKSTRAVGLVTTFVSFVPRFARGRSYLRLVVLLTDGSIR